jgi:hypothetical protein
VSVRYPSEANGPNLLGRINIGRRFLTATLQLDCLQQVFCRSTLGALCISASNGSFAERFAPAAGTVAETHNGVSATEQTK